MKRCELVQQCILHFFPFLSSSTSLACLLLAITLDPNVLIAVIGLFVEIERCARL